MTENRKHGWASWTVSTMLIVFVLYPLSYGPAIWLQIKAGHPEIGALARDIVYSPLQILSSATAGTSFSFIGSSLEAYRDWWIVFACR